MIHLTRCLTSNFCSAPATFLVGGVRHTPISFKEHVMERTGLGDFIVVKLDLAAEAAEAETETAGTDGAFDVYTTRRTKVFIRAIDEHLRRPGKPVYLAFEVRGGREGERERERRGGGREGGREEGRF